MLGIAQRIIRVRNDLSNEKFSPRKLFPTDPKTVGDHLILKRYEADLSQAEVAQMMGVSDRTLRAWEYDLELPTEAQWQKLCSILPLSGSLMMLETLRRSAV